MKKRYLEPEVEVLEFGTEDIITTSGTTSGGDDFDEGDFPEGWE